MKNILSLVLFVCAVISSMAQTNGLNGGSFSPLLVITGITNDDGSIIVSNGTGPIIHLKAVGGGGGNATNAIANTNGVGTNTLLQSPTITNGIIQTATAGVLTITNLSVIGNGVFGSNIIAPTVTANSEYNIIAYGADPTGVASSDVAFELAKIAASNGKIIIPAGRFKFTSTHNFSTNMIVEGNAVGYTEFSSGNAGINPVIGNSIIDWSSITTTNLFEITNGCSISGIMFIGSSNSTRGAAIAIPPNGFFAERFSIHDNSFYFGFKQIDSQLGAYWMIYNNLFLSPIWDAIYINNYQTADWGDGTIYANTFSENNFSANAAIEVVGSGGLKIFGNKINNLTSGVVSWSFTNALKIDPTNANTSQLLFQLNDVEWCWGPAVYTTNVGGISSWPSIKVDENYIDCRAGATNSLLQYSGTIGNRGSVLNNTFVNLGSQAVINIDNNTALKTIAGNTQDGTGPIFQGGNASPSFQANGDILFYNPSDFSVKLQTGGTSSSAFEWDFANTAYWGLLSHSNSMSFISYAPFASYMQLNDNPVGCSMYIQTNTFTSATFGSLNGSGSTWNNTEGGYTGFIHTPTIFGTSTLTNSSSFSLIRQTALGSTTADIYEYNNTAYWQWITSSNTMTLFGDQGAGNAYVSLVCTNPSTLGTNGSITFNTPAYTASSLTSTSGGKWTNVNGIFGVMTASSFNDTGTFQMNSTNATTGQVLTATDNSGHAAFAPSAGGGGSSSYSPLFTTNAGLIYSTNGVANVMEYGGNGSNPSFDNTPAIRAAIAALPNGGIVKFPAGIFSNSLIGGPILFTKPISFEGSGMGTDNLTNSYILGIHPGITTIVCSNANATMLMFTNTAIGAIKNMQVVNLCTNTIGPGLPLILCTYTNRSQKIDAENVYVYGGYIGWEEDEGFQCEYKNLQCQDQASIGFKKQNLIDADYGDDSFVSCVFMQRLTNALAGLYITSGGGVKMVNCKVNGIAPNCWQYGILLKPIQNTVTSDFQVANSSIENYTVDGIAIAPDTGTNIYWDNITFDNLEFLAGNNSAYYPIAIYGLGNHSQYHNMVARANPASAFIIFTGAVTNTDISGISSWNNSNIKTPAVYTAGNNYSGLTYEGNKYTTPNVSTAVVFNANQDDETIWNYTGPTLSSVTITLPSVSYPKQRLQYFTAAIDTTVTVVTAAPQVYGPSVTALPTNSTVTWEAIDTLGTWLCLGVTQGQTPILNGTNITGVVTTNGASTSQIPSFTPGSGINNITWIANSGGGSTFNPGSFSSGLSGTNISGTQTNVVYLSGTNGIAWTFTNSAYTLIFSPSNITWNFTNGTTNIWSQTPSNVLSIWQVPNGSSMTNVYGTNAAGNAMWGLGTQSQQNSSDAFSILLNGTIGGIKFSGSGNISAGNIAASASGKIISGFSSIMANVNGSMTSSNAIFTNLWSTNGITSTARNGLALISISPGASPYTYTSVATNNITVYIGGGIVTALAVNGTTIGTGLTLTGITPVILQTNESLTVTYTSAPLMNYKPF